MLKFNFIKGIKKTLTPERKALVKEHNNVLLYANLLPHEPTIKHLNNLIDSDLEFLKVAQKNSLEFNTPKIGDFVSVDGKIMRIANRFHNEDDEYQLCEVGKGGFCLFKSGHLSMGGSLTWITVKKDDLKFVKTRKGDCWFFNTTMGAVANSKIEASIEFKLWNAYAFREI